MRIDFQHDTKRSKLGQRIAGARVALLTHSDVHGALVSRPVQPVLLDSDGVVFCFVDLIESGGAFLHAANLSFIDATRGEFVSIAGAGRIVHARAQIDALRSLARPLWLAGDDAPATAALIAITPNVVDYWSKTQACMVRLLEMQAPLTAARESGSSPAAQAAGESSKSRRSVHARRNTNNSGGRREPTL